MRGRLLSLALLVGSGCWLHARGTVCTPGETASFAAWVSWNVLHGKLNGELASGLLGLPFRFWEPGDIVLFHNPDGGYGYWTHAALYVGDGRMVDASDFLRGVTVLPVDHYRHYREVLVLRPAVDGHTRTAAAHFAEQQVGTPYDPLAGVWETDRTYCSKLIWDAYRQAGHVLVPPRPWLVPDDLSRTSARPIWHESQ